MARVLLAAVVVVAGCGGGSGATTTHGDVASDPHLQCISPPDAGPVVHCNGLANAWEDSVSLFTFNEVQAMKACAAYTGRLGACVSIPDCAGLGRGIIQSDNVFAWVYSGQDAGHVIQQMGGPSSCDFVVMSDWD